MGLPPEERHCTRGSMMLCRLHHVLYDGKYVRLSGAVGELEIVTTDERQADGPVVFILNGVRYEEAA
jgi:predicted nucleic acid-binding protein